MTRPQRTSVPRAGAVSDVNWHRPLLFAMPVAALAFGVGLVLDPISGQELALDQLLYPIAVVVLSGLSLSLWLIPHSIHWVITTLVFAMSGLFLSKLIAILYFMPQTYRVQIQMTETFFWIPALQVLSFFVPGLRGARQASLAFFALFFLVSGVYVFQALQSGKVSGIVYALLELNLANLALLVVMNMFISFKDRYVRSVSEVETMRQLMGTDLLTGLPNRQRIDEVLAGRVFAGQPFTLLFVDLDGFKLVNDTLGHVAGDQALQVAARRLQQAPGADTFVGRLSGDEFVVLVSGMPSGGQMVAERLLHDLSQPIVIDHQIVHLSASIGLSVYPDDAPDPRTLIQHADSAMYAVKSLGKSGIRRFEADTDSAIERLKQLERALSQAQQAGQLHVMYQPICSLHDGVVRKLETLLRWTHPTFGPVPADEFIPIAEHNGQIIALGSWALRAACRQAQRWNTVTGRAVVVSVNVSPLQFIQPDFVELVRSALDEAQLPASSLEIELTESAVMRRLDVIKSSLRELQAMGVKIAIDDFGTGYSSLSYLRDLPINCVKIDRSFVHDLSSPRRAPQFALALIEAVIGIAGTLELQVVAEGVETLKQLEMLRDLGCDLGQGYYLSPPLAEDAALDAFLAPALFAPRLPTPT
ncbi:putative bifunctional diguanylate cyclase/phosphodiesterase [Deinococcus petrolearius]|uniref:Bifunctional diguanylate cyclase/phosphodiesterase n=1 Tax=Deinococcus petrolearius TaxID=1751295 RepID=A0ABW1DJN6_9DEIO